MRLLYELRSHLQYKIILPFLLLTLLVALAGSAVSFLFISSNAQERLNNQIAQVARATSDNVVDLESANLAFLREVTFAQANPAADAPAVADALDAGDSDGLARALEPYFRVSTQRAGVRLDRLIVFDTTGQSILDWKRVTDDASGSTYTEGRKRDLKALWFVPLILDRSSDERGDKYAGLLEYGDLNLRYLFTVAPVLKGDRVVGGVIVATQLETLLKDLSDRSQAGIMTLYRPDDGSAFASTQLTSERMDTLSIRSELVPLIRDLKQAETRGLFDVVTVNGRDYQMAYAPLRIRGDLVGVVSVALARDYVTGPWNDARLPLTVLTIALMLAITGLGIFIARQITRPLQELVATAQAVTGGDLERRSQVEAHDEVGILSESFNDMTAHLLQLYGAVRAEASQRAAIVESIADGVVVCDLAGDVLVINRAMRALLGLPNEANGPQRFEEIPLAPLKEGSFSFGQSRSADLFELHDCVVRVIVAPVTGDDGARLGDVYVLQDMTSEVAIDRAKTNFISTISHELRTPLTVLSGSAELILRNMVGPLNEEQRSLIETMRRQTITMTSLLNNVITIAGLESGTLSLEIEPIDLPILLEGMLWPIRSAMAAKNLELIVETPDEVPEVLADSHQLRNVLIQLLDNARRYTSNGAVSICVSYEEDQVRVDISDTGCGISADLSEQLFTRFTRGADGINSNERGMGLGLAIAKELIERQGGHIWLESTSKAGSTFSFTLPRAHADLYYSNSNLATAA